MIRRLLYTVELSGHAAGQVMITTSSQLAVIKRLDILEAAISADCCIVMQKCSLSGQNV